MSNVIYVDFAAKQDAGGAALESWMCGEPTKSGKPCRNEAACGFGGSIKRRSVTAP